MSDSDEEDVDRERFSMEYPLMRTKRIMFDASQMSLRPLQSLSDSDSSLEHDLGEVSKSLFPNSTADETARCTDNAEDAVCCTDKVQHDTCEGMLEPQHESTTAAQHNNEVVPVNEPQHVNNDMRHVCDSTTTTMDTEVRHANVNGNDDRSQLFAASPDNIPTGDLDHEVTNNSRDRDDEVEGSSVGAPPPKKRRARFSYAKKYFFATSDLYLCLRDDSQPPESTPDLIGQVVACPNKKNGNSFQVRKVVQED